MTMARATIWKFVLLAVLAVMTTLPATAQSARDLKNSGAVGERLDGYLGIVDDSAGGDIRGAVEAVRTVHRTASVVTLEMLKHFQAITDAVARTGCEPGMYTVRGQLSRSGSSARLFEAMG